MRRLRSALPAALALGAGLVLAAAVFVGAQSGVGLGSEDRDDLSFRHLSVEQGLRNASVTSVEQDALGFIWIGTLDGLFRWDGVELREFRRQAADSTSIGSNSVQVLAAVDGGDLWVGTDGGLNLYDAATESFQRIDGLPADPIVALVADSVGGAWAGMIDGGLVHLDGDGAITEQARHDPSDPQSLPHDVVESLYLDPTGALWVGTGNGLARREAAGRYRTFRPDSLDRFATVSAIAQSERGTLFVGTLGTGLYSFNPSAGRFTLLDLGEETPSTADAVTSVYEDRDGTVWVGTLGGGLRRLTPGTPEPTVYQAVAGDPGSLAGDEVTDVMEDRQGILWVATYNGLDRFDRARGTAVRLRHDPDDPTTLASNDVRSVLEASDGTLFVGTAETLDWSTDGRRFSHLQISIEGELVHYPVAALYQDDAGTVWVGAEGGYLYRFVDGRLQQVPVHLVAEGRELGAERNDSALSVSSLLEDSAGRFWVGTLSRGLGLYDRESNRMLFYGGRLGQAGALPDSRIRDIAEDADGRVWVATAGGLCRLDRASDTGEFTCFEGDDTPSDPVSLHTRADGTLWVGSMNGLFRLDTRAPEGGFTAYTTANSDLPGDQVHAIVEDEYGYLWLSTNDGLTRFEPVTELFTRRLGSGDAVDRSLNGAAALAADGRLYVGGTSGLLVFHPQRLVARNANPPQVVITGVEVAGQTVEPGGDILAVAAPVADRVELGPDQDYITFHFAALHFSDPAANSYRVRIEGIDGEGEWRDIGRTQSYPFNPPSPGRYTFMVQAANADGVWSEQAASLEVVVHPPWWRTWWAILGFIALALFALARADRWQRARLLREERERAERRETELRAETAEAERRKAQAESAALLAENERKAAELERARDVEEANAKLAAANERLETSLRDLRATQAQLVQSEKLASLGQLTAGIAHEIKNPLNFVNNFADLSVDLADELQQELDGAKDQRVSELLEDVGPILDDLKENARRIHEHGQRADRIVRSMLLHSRGGSGERGRVDLNRFVDEYANLAYHGARANDSEFQVALVRDFDEAMGEVEIVPQELGRVLINLLSNAFHAVAIRARADGAGYEPEVVLRTRRQDDLAVIQIVDNGTGIPDAVRQRIFEPFFTTKPTGEGTGLGLSLAHDIVTQVHGGQMSVESIEGEGTTFTVTLPRKPRPEDADGIGRHRQSAASS